MKKKILRFYLLFFILTFADSSEVWSLSAELGEDGVVRLSGSHSFECSPESYEDDKKSYAVAYLACGMPSCYSDDAGVFYSGSPSVAFNAEYNLSCRYPGPYEFGVGYVGGKWVDLMNGDRACTNNAFYESAEIYLPAGPQIDIISNDLVKGVKPIGVTYDFTYSAAMESSDIRQIQAYIDNALIYNKSDLSENGSAQISYNFSNKKGFILIKVSAGCGSNNNTVEKLVYVEPEDSCPLNVGKPVNAASGNVYTSETDFTLKGLTPITFTRHYDGSESTMRDFGQTWTHGYDTRVTKFANSAGNTYKVINPDGSNVYYIDNGGDGIYDVEFPKGEKSRLIKNPDNTFTREYFDGSKEEFNSYGRLTAVLDRNGSATALTRGANNNLTKITDPVGREINFTYNTSNKITSITIPDGSPAGRIYSYAYLSSGYLGKVTYPDGSERNYEYKNITGVGSKLSGIKDERGNYIEKHDYDSQGRATTSSSDGTNEKLTINYISDTQSTVTDSFGRVTTYTIDKTSGQSHPTNISGTGCKSCGQGDTTKTYDNNLNVTSITDANGNVTIMTYDARGNMLTRTEASGTPQQRTTTYTYNEFGQVLTGTDNDGNITSHTYDTSGNMLTKTEAYGTINERTTAYTYNAYGQIPTTTDPTGNIT
ncbi:MAG: RHS repeat protein, partial [Nitrospirae bacterium]|nr:RHS repeat protein [Nitrospirota bacterium]